MAIGGRIDGEPLSVAIGVFDGVHRGHRALLDRVVADGGHPTVLTFATNPAAVTRPDSFLGDLSTLDERLRLFEEAGVRSAVVIDFSSAFAQLDGVTFVNAFMERVAPVQHVVVGFDFHLGRGRDTGGTEMAQMLEHRRIRVDIVPALKDNGEPISSSRIRHYVRSGRIEAAARLLGRPYAYRVAGALPASLADATQVLPANGAYQARFIGKTEESNGTVRVGDGGRIAWNVSGDRWHTVEFEKAL